MTARRRDIAARAKMLMEIGGCRGPSSCTTTNRGADVSDAEANEQLASRVNNAIEKLHIKSECPTCGSVDWTLHHDPGLVPAIVLLSSGGSMTRPPPHYPVYIFTCENCGFVRAHLQSKIDGAGGPIGT